jgi:small-conductance mechanosensitive channel
MVPGLNKADRWFAIDASPFAVAPVSEVQVRSFDRMFIRDLVDPSTVLGAVFYGLLFLCVAIGIARTIRAAIVRLEHSAEGVIDRTATLFLMQLAQAAVYVIAAILYAHLVPVLHAIGTAMLTGAGIASVILGLAAQSTLGNLIAGVALLLYRPFRVGDRLRMMVPQGAVTAVVEELTLGYTFLQTDDHQRIVVPNSLMAGQVTVHAPPTQKRV